MRKIVHIGLFVTVILLMVSLYEKVEGERTGRNEIKVDNQISRTGLAHAKVYEKKIKKFGNVDIAVTLIMIAPQEVVVELVLDTHTVDLNYDISEISVLKDETGKEYRAVYWSGGKGGHHLSGELSFETLDEGVKELKFLLIGIDNTIKEFVWSL